MARGKIFKLLPTPHNSQPSLTATSLASLALATLSDVSQEISQYIFHCSSLASMAAKCLTSTILAGSQASQARASHARASQAGRAPINGLLIVVHFKHRTVEASIPHDPMRWTKRPPIVTTSPSTRGGRVHHCRCPHDPYLIVIPSPHLILNHQPPRRGMARNCLICRNIAAHLYTRL